MRQLFYRSLTFAALTACAWAQGNEWQLRDQQATPHRIIWRAPATIASDVVQYLPPKVWIDAKGFTAWGSGAAINDSTGAGYVVSNTDEYFTDQDNEVRGASVVVRSTRTTVDEPTQGWDQFGVAGVVVLGAMNLPSDPVYGSPYIRGQQKPFQSELYYQTPITPYTANWGENYVAALAQVASGVTLNNWAGLIVAQPGYLGSGGHVVNGSGIWIQNLQDAGNILTSGNAAAIKIDGLANFGRIVWPGASVSAPTTGVLELGASSVVRTVAGVGLMVGGAGASAGLDAGSISILHTQIIDGSLNISTTGYINTSGAYKTGGTTVIDSSRNGAFAGVTATGSIQANTSLTNTAGFYMTLSTGPVGIIQYAPGSPETINIGNIHNVQMDGDLVTVSTHHVDAGDYYLRGSSIINGSGVFVGSAVAATGSVQANTSLTNTAGFYMTLSTGAVGIIQYAPGSPETINIGNIHNVQMDGDLVTVSTHHVDAGDYYLRGSSIINGSGVFVGSAVESTGSVQANTSLTNTAGFYMTLSTGPVGIIQYAPGSPETINIGNVYNIAATGDIVTSGSNHHVGAGTGSTGGYYVGSTQIVDGTRAATFRTLHVTGTATLDLGLSTSASIQAAGFSVTGSGTINVNNFSSGGYQCVHANAAGTLMVVSGSDCVVVGGASGANFALSNLASVSINSPLLFQSGIDIGGYSNPVRYILLYGNGTYGSTSFELTGTPTANRVLAFPDRSGTIATSAGTLTNGDCASIDSTGNFVDAGAPCTAGSGSGTVAAGASGQLAYYTGTGTTVGGTNVSGDATFAAPYLWLNTVNSSYGACGDSGHICTITTNAKGLVTAQSAVAVSQVFAGSIQADSYYLGSTQVIDTGMHGDLASLTLTGTAYNTLSVTGGGVLASTQQANSAAYNAVYAPNGGFAGVTVQATDTGNHAVYAPNGGVTAGTGTNGGLWVGASHVIDGSNNAAVANLTISGSCTGCPNTTYTAGTGVSIVGSAISIGQNVATSASPQFYAMTLTGTGYNTLSVTGGGVLASTQQANSAAYNAVYAPNGGFAGVTVQATDTGNHAVYAPNGGVTAGTGTNGGLWVGASHVIDGSNNAAVANLTISGSCTGCPNPTYTAGTGVSIVGSAISIGQDVATSASPQFYAMTLTGTGYNTLSVTGGGVLASTQQANSAAYNAVYAPNGGFAGVTVQATDTGNHAVYAPNGGVTAGTGTNGGLWVGASHVIDGSRNGSFAAITVSSCSGCGGSGTVTAVTGTGPIASSGGTAPAISCPTCYTTAGGTVSGGIASTGSIQANTSLTDTAGFYINNTGVIQYDTGSSTISIGNVYNVTATGDIVTSGTHHVGAGTGGYYIGTTQVINGSGQWIGSAIGDSYISSASTWNGKVGAVYGSGGISSSGGTAPTISCANCVLLGGSQINSSGVFIGAGVSTSYGVSAGSFAISGTTVIDGSRNVSTTGYVNGASFSIGGSSTINSSRQWIGSAIGDSYISSASTWNGKVGAVYGSGGISSSGGTGPTISCAYCVLLGGSQINSSGAFVGAGVSVGSYGISGGSYAITGGYYGATGSFVDQGGTTHYYRGGIILN